MSPQETQILQDFLSQLVQARGIVKDPQADAMIASALAQQADAAYLLVQRALLMDQALNAAKAQIASLQSQLQSAQPASRGFLDPTAWGNSAISAPRPVMPQPVASTPAYPAPPMQSAPAPSASPGFLGGGAGGLLGTMAATAAGVAGGAFLFQGIEHLMGHNTGAGLGSNFLNEHAGMAPLAAPVENTTINHDYGNDNTSDNSTDDTGVGLFDDTASNDGTDNDGII